MAIKREGFDPSEVGKTKHLEDLSPEQSDMARSQLNINESGRIWDFDNGGWRDITPDEVDRAIEVVKELEITAFNEPTGQKVMNQTMRILQKAGHVAGVVIAAIGDIPAPRPGFPTMVMEDKRYEESQKHWADAVTKLRDLKRQGRAWAKEQKEA